MNDYYNSVAIDYTYYWQLLKTVFKKNIKSSFVMAILVGVLVFLYSLTFEAQYRAQTVMHVAPQTSAVFNIQELFLNRRDPAFRETQVGIIRSKVLIKKVVERLELDKLPIFNARKESVFDKIKQKLGFNNQVTNDPKVIKRLIINKLSEEVIIQSQRDSYLISLSIILSDPQLAADITNTLAQEYINSVQTSTADTSESSEQWLLDRLEIVNNDLKKAELALQEFKERENIIGSSEQNDGIVSQEVDMISIRLLEAKQKRLGSEALYQQVIATERGRGDLQGISAIQNDTIVQSIRNELVELESKQGELSQRYGPEHRRMVELASQITATNANLDRQVQRVVSAIKSEYDLDKESESFLKSSLGTSTNKVQSLGRKQFDLLSLEQDVRTQRDVYQAFLKRLNENRATGVSINENVRITDPAEAPLRALKSKAPIFITIAAILSALFGLFIGLLRELFDNTISNDQDISNKLSSISLGSVPMIDDSSIDINNANVAYHYFANNNLSQFSESIRTVRSSLMLSSIDEKKRRILVTSTVPSEGKTSMAVSLALAFSQVQKTLLIDCDLRRPSLEELFEKTAFNRRRAGINDLCLETAKASECIHNLPNTNLDIIPAGTISPNPQELFCSARFKNMLDKLSEVYDVIILDSAPTGGLSDSMLLSTIVDQVAYVVRAGITPVAKIRASIDSLKKANSPLEGIIVNQVPSTDSAFSYYYGASYYNDALQKEITDKAS